jgi:DNA-binding PadR family transcriptional regulator
VSNSNSRIGTDLDARLIQGFMDVIILKLLRRNDCTSGYALIRYFHQKFHVLISSGTVYSTLYSLERQGFIIGDFDGKRRVYRLTKNGEEFFDEICSAGQRSHALFLSIFSDTQELRL